VARAVGPARRRRRLKRAVAAPRNDTWIDSFYFTFITVATIGFSETIDLAAHPMGRLFTVVIAIISQRTIVVIEPSREALDRWLEVDPSTRYLHGDAADDDALRFAGVQSAAGVFAPSAMPPRRDAPARTKSCRRISPVACASPRPWFARTWSTSWTRCCTTMTTCAWKKSSFPRMCLHGVNGGATLVVMATPQGRQQLEKALQS